MAFNITNPKAVVSVMMRGSFRSYWSQTGTYESVLPLINKDFDGLKTAIIAMLSGNEVRVKTTTFQNDMVTFRNKDDVLTLLIHLGYLAYNQQEQTAYIPNEEIRMEFMDADAVADYIDKIHMEYASAIKYHDENSLSSVLTIAYLSAMRYYFKPVWEFPEGRGFADFVFIPKPQYLKDYPALVVELKWNQNMNAELRSL